MQADPLPPLDTTDGLALAMVAMFQAPVLLLDGDLVVIAASACFCRVFQIDMSAVAGRAIYDLGRGEWDVAQLRVLLKSTAAGHIGVDAYEMDLNSADGPARRLVINAQALDYGHPERIRLLVTTADVTDARAADKLRDDLLREKGVLLQEMQHRVANSLQIIASVLMQSARKVLSEETRSYLRDAHSRVISIATLQHQLATSRIGDVELRPYFTELCESLSASMIRDHDQLSIEVRTDDSSVEADASVGLGLIVTELVINALKHAFPDGRAGKIVVEYNAKGADWTLSVSDTGAGMPKARARAKPGLGTSIVEALARQLHAQVQVGDANPGAAVSIIHVAEATPPNGGAAGV